jgi:hypothetical protein
LAIQEENDMRGLCLLAASVLFACSSQGAASPAGRPRTEEPVDAAALRAGTTLHRESADAASSSPPARLEVERVEGVASARLHALLEPALERARQCLPGRGGKLHIRVTSRESRLVVSAEPGHSLDPTARACVLEALTTVSLEETASNAGGPGVPPSNFTSLVTVSW